MLKSIWNEYKRPLWYISAIFVPIFMVGDICIYKIPQLMAGFDGLFELFCWAFCLNGVIMLPWLTYDVWKCLICNPDPETGAYASPFPNFWGGGQHISGGPSSFVVIPALTLFALLFSLSRDTVLIGLQFLFSISLFVMMTIMIPMLIAMMCKMAIDCF